jgi:hypothetical protein
MNNVQSLLVAHAPSFVKRRLISSKRDNQELHEKLCNSKDISVLTTLAMYTPHKSVQEALFNISRDRPIREDGESILLSLANNNALNYTTKSKFNKFIDNEDEGKVLRLSALEFVYAHELINRNLGNNIISRMFYISTLTALNRNISPTTHQRLLSYVKDFLEAFPIETCPKIINDRNNLPYIYYPPATKNIYRLLRAFKMNTSLNPYTLDMFKESEKFLTSILTLRYIIKNPSIMD